MNLHRKFNSPINSILQQTIYLNDVGLWRLMAITLQLKLPGGLPVVFICLCLMLNACDDTQQIRRQTSSSADEETVGNDRSGFKGWLISAIKNQEASGISTIDSANRVAILNAYKIHQYKPIWLQKNGQAPLTIQWLQVLNDIQADGLDSMSYNLKQIRELDRILEKGRSLPDSMAYSLDFLLTASFIKLSNDMLTGTHPGKIIRKEWKNKNDSLFDPGPVLIHAVETAQLAEAINEFRPQAPLYQSLRNEYLRLREIQRGGDWGTIPVIADSAWRNAEAKDVSGLRKRLQLEIGLPVDTLNSHWSNDLKEAIRRFQFLNHLNTNGKLDSITTQKLNVSAKQKMRVLALNMERLRWLTRTFEQPYILVNVPLMELNLVDHDSNLYRMRVVVGRPSRPTTMLDAKLQNIVFSPPWTIPPTIMKEEVIPGIARRGSAYLTRRGLKAYDLNGKVVSPLKITRSNFTQFRVGQAPGYNSSLGEVKFNLLNPWSIYLHDTPHREDFVKRNRALSSGCIRVHHPKEFAEILLADSLNYSLLKIDSICALRKTKFVTPKQTFMVHIVYLTNATDSSGNMMYLKDIYHWDKVN